jgi:hypothetical protein
MAMTAVLMRSCEGPRAGQMICEVGSDVIEIGGEVVGLCGVVFEEIRVSP